MAANPLEYLNPFPGLNFGFNAAMQSRQAGRADETLDLAREREARLAEQMQDELLNSKVSRKAQEVTQKINEFRLKETEREALNELDDAPKFQKFQTDVSNYLQDPLVAPPVMPEFKSKTMRSAAAARAQDLDQYSKRAENMKLLDEHRRQVERYNQDRLTTATDLFRTTGIDAVEVGQDGVPMVNEEKFAQANKIATERGLVTPEEARSNSILKAEMDAGKFPTPEEQARRKAQLIASGGKIPNLPAKALQDLSGLTATVEISDDLLGMIKESETRFGKNWLDPFLGKFDKPYNEVVDTLKKRTDARSQAAYDITQLYTSILNGTARSRSGQAVTATEISRILKEVGNMADQNFTRAIKNFNKNEKRSLGVQVRNYENYDVPENIRAVSGIDDVKVYKSLDEALSDGAKIGDTVDIMVNGKVRKAVIEP